MYNSNLSLFLGVYAYVTLKEGVKESKEKILEEVKALVKKQIAPYAVPEMTQVSENR